MIAYDRKNWWRTTLRFSGTVLPNVLGRVAALTGFSLLLCLLERYLLEEIGYPLPMLDQLGHSVLGVALSMLIVFRTGSSNSRYWDGRAYWGSIVNGSRNLVRLAETYASPAQDLATLVTAYVVAIRENLRSDGRLDGLEQLIPVELLHRVKVASNPPVVLATAISDWISTRLRMGQIDTYQAMSMEQVVNSLVDNQGACERIAKTPLPFIYASLIKQILIIYLASLPFVLIAKMGFAAPLVVAVVSFGMLGIEEAGIEIESPFETSPNGLPLEQICTTIAKDVLTITSVKSSDK